MTDPDEVRAPSYTRAMAEDEIPNPATRFSDETWEKILTSGHRPLKAMRGMWRHLPSDPRCRLCVSPFGGFGGKVSGLMGFGPSRMNPNFCAKCLESLPPGGAEVDIAVLFADVRGSTATGHGATATQFAGLMNRFYAKAAQVLIAHDALIDKLLGDEVMALFVRGIAGPEYRQRACEAAVGLLETVAPGTDLGGEISIGVSVHSGPAFVGNVGGEGVFDFTALGDTVNVGARLQSVAGPGELVMSEAVFGSTTGWNEAERKSVTVKGKPEPIEVRVVRI